MSGAIYAVLRCSEMPKSPVPSAKRQCKRCDHDVWVSERSLFLAEDPRCEIVCSVCLHAQATTSSN